jgi:hypothetical protein
MTDLPGFGFRHPELAALLASRTPATTGSMSWVNGTMPLRVGAYTAPEDLRENW